jgi:hypothetical protein
MLQFAVVYIFQFARRFGMTLSKSCLVMRNTQLIADDAHCYNTAGGGCDDAVRASSDLQRFTTSALHFKAAAKSVFLAVTQASLLMLSSSPPLPPPSV